MLGPVIALIRAKLATDAPLPAADVAFAWEPFEPPSPPRPWALVRVVGGRDTLRTLAPAGAARGEQAGVVAVAVYTPKGSGQQLGAEIADGFAAVLRRLNERRPDGTQLVTEDARIAHEDDEVAEPAEAYDAIPVSVPFAFHYGR
ncbi:hypothetical protein [Azospirillum sp. ST 5-10]|uniref:hypothetical protein n=1 Tax=unclassified Azospirillum TaxID=2630922 RepID=UPI003F4A5C9E